MYNYGIDTTTVANSSIK